MRPFNEPLDDRSRHLFGRYRPRYSMRKVGYQMGTNSVNPNGTNWVDMPFIFSSLSPTINDATVYQIKFVIAGPWVGNKLYRMLVNGQKVYPFDDDDYCPTVAWEHLGCLSLTVRTGEECTLQIRSDNIADTGVGLTAMAGVKFVIWERDNMWV